MRVAEVRGEDAGQTSMVDFQDAYVNGVRVQLIIGPTGTGKSVHANQMLSLEQKYGGFTFIFDIGGSYESVVELYGGRIDRVGKDGPRINPFALEATESNIAFLHSFIKLLLTNSGATIGPEDDDEVFKSVKGKAVAAAAEAFKASYPGTLHFDYTWDQKKGAALGIQQIWRDDKFTYGRYVCQVRELFAGADE
jgi:hypothetical protein